MFNKNNEIRFLVDTVASDVILTTRYAKKFVRVVCFLRDWQKLSKESFSFLAKVYLMTV